MALRTTRLICTKGWLILHQPSKCIAAGSQPLSQLDIDKYQQRKVGITRREQKELLRRKPTQPAEGRLLKVAFIGAPNAGKSTLANKLLAWRAATKQHEVFNYKSDIQHDFFSSVSKKVHTTRCRTVGVMTEGDTQVVFLDTPGIITPAKMKRHNLERSMLVDPHSSLMMADCVAVVVDVSNVWDRSRLCREVLEVLALHPDKRSILILNKTDLVKKKSELLAVTRHLTAGVVNGTRHCRTRKTSQRRVDVGAIFSRMQQKSERQDAAGTEAASRRDGDSTDVGFVHEMKMEDGTTVEVHTGTMAEFTDMYEGRMSDGVGMEADSVIRDHVRDDRGTEDIVRGERTGDIVRDDRTEDIVRGDMEEDIVRGDMTEDIVKGDRTEDIVGGDRTEDIVGGDRTEDIVRGDMAEDIVRGDRTEDIVGGDRTEDIVRNLSTAAGWQTYSKELRTSGRNVSELKGWPHFERVFMVSALDGDGIWDIKNYLLDTAPRGQWLYHRAVITNQDPRLVARQCVQEKLLDHLPNEIPYQIRVRLALWEEDEQEMLRAAFDLICYRRRHLFYALGKGGSTARKIAMEAKQELMRTFRRELSLRLVVRLHET